MSKTNNYAPDITMIKRKKGAFKGLKIFAFLIICFAFVFVLSDLFSFILSPTSSAFLFFKGTNVVVNEQVLYAVNMGQYDTLEKAQQESSLFTMQGAGSYVWQQKEKYVVIGHIYEKKSDADTVKNNIITSNPTVFVNEIKLKKVKLDLPKLTEEQREVIKKSLNLITDIQRIIYENSVKLDKKEITSTIASSNINQLKSQAIITSSSIDLINTTFLYECNLKIKNTYVEIVELLNELVLKLISNNDQVNRDVKYSYINLIKIKYDLFNNL